MIILCVTNYSLILARNFSVKLSFHMSNYKIAMAAFCAKNALQVQRCYECVYEFLKF